MRTDAHLPAWKTNPVCSAAFLAAVAVMLASSVIRWLAASA
jgi:hypothetical protein